MPVGIIVLDTGCFKPSISPRVNVIKADCCNAVWGFPGIRPGYTPNKDGSDSQHGSGTDNCNRLDVLLRNDPSFKIFSLKIGDTGSPLCGVTPSAVLPGLRKVIEIGNTYRDWKWVCFLNYNAAAIKEPAKLADQLYKLAIPVVVPVGTQGINLDGLGLALPNGFMSVAIDTDDSDFGAKMVTVAASDYMVGVAALAKARLSVNGSADQVINQVIKQAKQTARWSGKSITAGVL